MKHKVITKTKIKLMASNKSLMVCEPLPDWLSTKRIIDSVDLSGDNL